MLHMCDTLFSIYVFSVLIVTHVYVHYICNTCVTIVTSLELLFRIKNHHYFVLYAISLQIVM